MKQDITQDTTNYIKQKRNPKVKKLDVVVIPFLVKIEHGKFIVSFGD
jgi:hypothetical protein